MKSIFHNRLIIITGGSSGLGKKLAEVLIAKGARLALIARDKEKLQSTKKTLGAIPGVDDNIGVFPCDVMNYSAVKKTFNQIEKKMGTPDILINSAGIIKESYFEKQSLDIFNSIQGINFYGTLHCIKAVLPFFKENGGGRIVNISSIAGLMGVFGYSAYCASKHAVAGLSKSLRTELTHQNIKIHLIYPPEFESPMVDDINTYRTVENQVNSQTIPVMKVDTVAAAIIRGIEKNKFEIITGLLTRIVVISEKFFPAFGRILVDYKIKKKYKGPGE